MMEQQEDPTSSSIRPNSSNNNNLSCPNVELKSSVVETMDSCDSSSGSLMVVVNNNPSNHHHNRVRSGNNNSSSSNTGMSNETWLSADINITETEARLIGIISTFLHVHPFGASLEYIWSYAQKVLPTVRPNQLEALMYKFPTLFRQELSGVGATLERKWIFVGFS